MPQKTELRFGWPVTSSWAAVAAVAATDAALELESVVGHRQNPGCGVATSPAMTFGSMTGCLTCSGG